MGWPLPSHFSLSLQNPASGLKDPVHQKLTVERNRLGQPRPWSGAFAVVFKGTDPAGTSIALRAFTSEVPGQRERYRAIGEYLSTKKLKCLVAFRFTADGIRSGGDGQWYPLLTMDWVEGLTLFDWVQKRALAHDSKALGQVAERWIAMIAELAAAGIAHGDLQHANVMVTPQGELKLVDYDCMAVPALFGTRNTEIGVHPYQHPGRDSETQLAPTLDRFSAMFILIVLKSLAADPTLWERYIARPGDADEYDKLLIRGDDLESPRQSPLIQELLRSKDAEVRPLLETLLTARNGPLDQVPTFDDALASFGKLEQLLKSRAWADAVEFASRFPAGKLANAPPALQATLKQARERVACRRAVEAALAAGDEAGAAKAYRGSLLDDDPTAAETVALVKHSAKLVPLLTQLDRALAAGNGRDAVAIWTSNASILGVRPSGLQRDAAVQQWKLRNRACDRVLSLANGHDPAALTQAWTELLALGGHPEAEPIRVEIQKIVDRHAAWQRLQSLPSTIDETNDQQLIASWNESLFAGWPQAESQRRRQEEARSRLQLLSQWSKLDRPGQALTEVVESKLIEAVRRFPAKYSQRVIERAELASKRLAALRSLRNAGDSERLWAEAWSTMVSLDAKSLATAEEARRGELALRRTPLLDKLEALPQSIEQREIQLLKVWKPDLDDCADAHTFKAEHDTASKRYTLLRRIRRALKGGDDLTADRLLKHPMLHRYPLPDDWKPRVTQVRETASEAGGVLTALQNRDQVAFDAAFNAPAIRRFAREFALYQNLLTRWTEQLVASPAARPMEPTCGRPPILPTKEPGTYELRWKWPAPRFADRCRVIVCERPPSDRDSGGKVFLEMAITRREYEDRSGRLVLVVEPEWDGASIAVYSIIDLGVRQLMAGPFVAGRVAARAKPRSLSGGAGP